LPVIKFTAEVGYVNRDEKETRSNYASMNLRPKGCSSTEREWSATESSCTVIHQSITCLEIHISSPLSFIGNSIGGEEWFKPSGKQARLGYAVRGATQSGEERYSA
jgi:hypothetical protein